MQPELFTLPAGVTASPDDIRKGFKAAFAKPWPERLRYEACRNSTSPLCIIFALHDTHPSRYEALR
jgi:hypothetical protein